MVMEPPPPGYNMSQECTCMDPHSAAINGHDAGCVYSSLQATVAPKISGVPTCDCQTPAPLNEHLEACAFAVYRNSRTDPEDHITTVTIAEVQTAILRTPINTGETPDSQIITPESTTLPPVLGNVPMMQQTANLQPADLQPKQSGVWDDVASSVQPAAQAQNLEALARQVHQQLGLTDVVSLGFILISLQGAVEFDQKMQGMR